MDRYVAKALNVSCRTVDGTAFVYDQKSKMLLKLDEVGSFIWDQINGTRTIKEISGICCETFAGDTGDIQSAVLEFVNDLHDKDVVGFSIEPFEGVMISAC